MSTKKIALSQVVSINPRTDSSRLNLKSEVAFLGMADISETGVISNIQTKKYEEVQKGYTCFQNGDVLLAKITPCFENGKAVVVQGLASEIGFGSTEFHVLRPSKEIDGRFLFHLVWNHKFRLDGAQRMTGSAGQKRVPTIFLEDYKLNLPDIKEQKRIAAILDKADSLRRKRQQAIQLADDFLRATFIDMFGDPVTNPKGWKTVSLDSIADIRDGTHYSPEFYDTGYPFVTTRNLVGDTIDLESAQKISEEDFLEFSKRSAVSKGDILMPMIGTIGNPVLVTIDDKFAIKNVALIKATKNKDLDNYILRILDSHYFAWAISQVSRGGTQKFVSLGDIRRLKIPLPENDVLKKFRSHCKVIDKLKVTNRKSQRDNEYLCDSLCQHLF